MLVSSELLYLWSVIFCYVFYGYLFIISFYGLGPILIAYDTILMLTCLGELLPFRVLQLHGANLLDSSWPP